MSVKLKSTKFRNFLYLQQVFIHGSIRAAAEKNGIKPSNLSCIIRDMEKQSGQKLFTRHSRGLVPTPQTLELIGEIANLDRMLTEIVHKINLMKGFNSISLYLPDNLKIHALKEFSEENAMEIIPASCVEDADVIVSYTKPDTASYMVSVENKFGQGLLQTVWVCAVNRPLAVKLARFIILQMHSQ